ncbi:MAG: hypothetical protein WC834_08210 [Eubacteriales bacterium]
MGNLQTVIRNIKLLFSLNLTRVVLVLLILTIVDIPIVRWENRLLRESGQIRLATHEIDSIAAQQSQIKNSKGFKIVYLGDSVVYGPGVTPTQTAPYYLEQELRRRYPDKDIRVFNYGYKGYGISETFLMLNTLRNSGVNMVIFGVNFSYFNRQPVIEYTNAAKVNPDIFQSSRVKKLGVNLPEVKNVDWNRQVSGFLASHWALYRNRSTIAAWILGKSLGEKLYDYKFYIFDPLTYQKQEIYWSSLHQPWSEKNYSKELSLTNSKVGWINLASANPQVEFYKLIMDLLQNEHITTLFYATPLNYEMYEHYNKLDRPKLNRYLSDLRALSRPQQTNFMDLTYAVPGKNFADSLHMFAPGYRLLAQSIENEITRKGLIK